MVLGVVRQEWPCISVPNKWDRMLDEGTVLGLSMVGLGLFWIVRN